MIPQRFCMRLLSTCAKSSSDLRCLNPMLSRLPTLKRLAHQVIANERASKINHDFFQDVLTKKNCHKFYGYSTQLTREQGHQPQSRTKAIYMPLIDMKPSDPDTMLTSMVKVQNLSSQTDKPFSILTCDQQLYWVAVQIPWEEQDRFNNMYLRLGGMHALMSFVLDINVRNSNIIFDINVRNQTIVFYVNV